MFSKQQLIDLYRKRAPHYDFSANLYYLIGVREFAYRKQAVARLRLQPGDTVVEIGCGTGLNFSLLQRYIGPTGKIICVDMTDKMLARAESRIHKEGWSNVELIHQDAAEYEFPSAAHGILSTFALTLCPDFDDVICRGAEALSESGRWVVLDFKRPTTWARVLTPLLLATTRPFGVTLDLADRHPWESIDRYLQDAEVEERYFGFVYIASGRA